MEEKSISFDNKKVFCFISFCSSGVNMSTISLIGVSNGSKEYARQASLFSTWLFPQIFVITWHVLISLSFSSMDLCWAIWRSCNWRSSRNRFPVICFSFSSLFSCWQRLFFSLFLPATSFPKGVCKTRTGYLRIADADGKMRIEKCGWKKKMRIAEKVRRKRREMWMAKK